ncbi:hypothetical protein AWJ19_33130 [Paenibacillus sp. DMB5]|nr:hypothetical protein AWJ19_33130 [Paenibacillus sp. DMB5]
MKHGLYVMPHVQSIREAFAEASSFLDKSGCNEPQRSSQLLLEHVLGVSGAAYYMALADPFPAELREAWEAAVGDGRQVSRCSTSPASRSFTAGCSR